MHIKCEIYFVNKLSNKFYSYSLLVKAAFELGNGRYSAWILAFFGKLEEENFFPGILLTSKSAIIQIWH